MNENINLIEILKDAPKGTKLWSPLCGECKLYKVDVFSQYPIKVDDREYKIASFSSDGSYSNYIDGECLLFPSKDNRNWSIFKAPWKHKHFEAFQKVLISHFIDNFPSEEIWVPSLYSYYDKKEEVHVLIDSSLRDDDEIIPYEGNEDKLGKPIKS